MRSARAGRGAFDQLLADTDPVALADEQWRGEIG